jgi:hypothetical protein
MKKLSLEMLRLSTSEILERSQMKRITGGYTAGNYMCRCKDIPGEWRAWYSSQSAANGSIGPNCGSGGGYCGRYYYV